MVLVAGVTLETRWTGPPPDAAPTIVFLHEGLGCAALWRDFPDRLAAATGCGALVYSRAGYGASDPPLYPLPVDFMHREALDVLPRVLEQFALRDVILFGHSDGASIALIYSAGAAAGAGAGGGRAAVRGLVLEAPHVFVEPVCSERIRGLATEPEATALRRRLARHHGANAEAMLRAWTEVWLRPEFLSWNIEPLLPAVSCPLLVVQGEDDEYGTLRQVESIAARAAGPVETLVLPGCGHAPHVDRPREVLAAATGFVRGLAAGA